MINTIQLKTAQLRDGFFKVGSGPEVILIQGSCRAVAYVTYLRDWNEANGNRFTICYIDPFSFNWDMQEQRVDYEMELLKQESNQALLDMLRSVDIFIHEYYANAGMFNVDKTGSKNIYQFGLSPKQDICIPSFNDVFVLTREIVSFDMDIRKMAIQDYNVTGKLSERTLEIIEETRCRNLDKFYKICALTDFPEFAEIFKDHYKKVRLFWTFNHVGKAFNHLIFDLMNKKFLRLENVKLSEVDLFANNYTYLSEYDHGYGWNEEIKPLKDIL
jgi:hypothetical protein